MRSPLAICWRMSALGLRRPRSIWLRYGLDTPAAWASWRMEIFACSRCSRMYSPIELTVTLRMSSSCHKMLAIANAQQALWPSGAIVGDAQEGAGLGGAHGRTLGDPGQLRGPFHEL